MQNQKGGTLICINSPHFCAAVIVENDRVVRAAPILGYMRAKSWSEQQVLDYCKNKKWEVVLKCPIPNIPVPNDPGKLLTL